MSLRKALYEFFNPEPPLYAHRHRTIEIVAAERGIDIDSLTADVRKVLEEQGRVAAVRYLRKRFHVSLSVAWRFVDKLDR